MITNFARPINHEEFYKKRLHIKPQKNDPPLKVKVGSLVGSAIGTVGAVYIISKNQSNLSKATKNIFNINYSESELLSVALSGIIGGLVAGTLVDEKKYAKAKTKEAMHQTIANVVFPLLFISAGQKIYEKINIPSFISKITSQIGNKIIKNTIEIIPRLLITIAGLVSGVYSGTYVSNKINHLSDENHEDRKIKPLDFMYHPDDIATTLVLADKKGVIQKTLGKIIPPIFTICGYETGVKR